jgi:hypothetical protein
MLKDFLFEIQCAEEIGAYRIADKLDADLIKLANSNYKTLRNQIQKKYLNTESIKSVDYSPSQQKFIITADAGLSNKVKRDIQKIVSPYNLSFRYSMKDIDSLMGAETQDPMEKHIQSIDNPLQDYIGLDEFDEMEPTDEELRQEEEFPADPISEDPYSLDQFLMEEARKQIKKYYEI